MIEPKLRLPQLQLLYSNNLFTTSGILVDHLFFFKAGSSRNFVLKFPLASNNWHMNKNNNVIAKDNSKIWTGKMFMWLSFGWSSYSFKFYINYTVYLQNLHGTTPLNMVKCKTCCIEKLLTMQRSFSEVWTDKKSVRRRKKIIHCFYNHKPLFLFILFYNCLGLKTSENLKQHTEICPSYGHRVTYANLPNLQMHTFPDYMLQFTTKK